MSGFGLADGRRLWLAALLRLRRPGVSQRDGKETSAPCSTRVDKPTQPWLNTHMPAAIIPNVTRGSVSEQEYHGCIIVKTVTGWSYPQNGNAHAPTPRILWAVRRDGRLEHSGLHRLADAKAFVDEYLVSAPAR